MTTDSQGRSARIYQFPVRAIVRSAAKQDKPLADASARVPATAFGSGWYHDAAIQEAERAVKR